MNKNTIDDLLQYGERVTLECKKIPDSKGRWTTYKFNTEFKHHELPGRLSNELSNRLSNGLSNGLSNELSETESTTISILSLIRENPYITRKEIASKIGISLNAIQKHINKLKFNNQIKREGPATRGGYWIVLSE
jgi:predicted HTH transcriptional regulator